jgi:cytosine permease
MGSEERVAQEHEAHLVQEYENEPVPKDKRHSLASVTSVWAGFPLVITSSISGGAIVHGLGFLAGIAAIGIGCLLLFAYVSALSAIAARTGKNFALQAAGTFGRKGFLLSSALLSTLVLGWFAVQSAEVGAVVSTEFPVSPFIVSIVAGLVFSGLTLLGIRALEIIGMISGPLFLIFGITAVISATSGGADILGYSGAGGASVMLFGSAVTLVFALFADSGTMTADFTRWAKSPKDAVIATASAFPVGHFVTMLFGGLVAAGAGAAGLDATIFSSVAALGGAFPLIAVILLSINLASVCTHCLYNAAVGWSSILHKKMRVLTLILGIIGTIIAALGAWAYFVDWLNLLGIIVPPIGAIIIVDQAFIRKGAKAVAGFRWQPFAAWACGSVMALLANMFVPELSNVVVGLIVGAAAYWIIAAFTKTVKTAAVAAETE